MRRIHDILDAHAAAMPNRLAIIDFDGAETDFIGFAAASRSASRVLVDAGVRPGDRVLIAGENSLALAAFLLACGRLDAWVVPVNARVTQGELSRIADHASIRAAVFTDGVSSDAARHADAFGAEQASGAFGSVRIAGSLDAVPEAVSDAPQDQVAALLYTTGTTGAPKGVMLTHGNFLYMSEGSSRVRAITADDTLLSVIPMTHVFGLSSAFLAGLRAGAVIRCLPRFTPDAVFQAFAEGVSVMPAVPQIYALLMQHAEKQGWTTAPAPNLRYISAGGAPLDPDWKRRVEAFFGRTLHNGYGMTEAAPGICLTRVGMERDDIACGPPMDGQEVRLIPPPGRNTLVDGVGQIVCRGPNVMKGYYQNREATAEALDAEGWLRTGDLGKWTEDGAMQVVGRCKELIIRSGFNVYPPEVEAALSEHPDVAIAAVVGRPETGGNEEIVAFVQRAPDVDIDPAALTAHLEDRIAAYKRPGRIVVVDELPSASTGKILKHTLLTAFAAHPALTD